MSYKQRFQCGVEIIRRDLLTGRWAPYIETAITLNPCYDADSNGAEVSYLLPLILEILILSSLPPSNCFTLTILCLSTKIGDLRFASKKQMIAWFKS